MPIQEGISILGAESVEKPALKRKEPWSMIIVRFCSLGWLSINKDRLLSSDNDLGVWINVEILCGFKIEFSYGSP